MERAHNGAGEKCGAGRSSSYELLRAGHNLHSLSPDDHLGVEGLEKLGMKELS